MCTTTANNTKWVLCMTTVFAYETILNNKLIRLRVNFNKLNGVPECYWHLNRLCGSRCRHHMEMFCNVMPCTLTLLQRPSLKRWVLRPRKSELHLCFYVLCANWTTKRNMLFWPKCSEVTFVDTDLLGNHVIPSPMIAYIALWLRLLHIV